MPEKTKVRAEHPQHHPTHPGAGEPQRRQSTSLNMVRQGQALSCYFNSDVKVMSDLRGGSFSGTFALNTCLCLSSLRLAFLAPSRASIATLSRRLPSKHMVGGFDLNRKPKKSSHWHAAAYTQRTDMTRIGTHIIKVCEHHIVT